MRYLRSTLPLALCVACGVAHAQMTFSNISAQYTLTPPGTTFNWVVIPNGSAMNIDFLQNAPPFKVGASTGFSTGISTITYDVVSTTAISGVDLLLQGDVQNFGRIQFTQSASAISGSLGSIAGSILGASWGGSGANGAFTKIFHLSFSQSVTSFSITQTLASDINGQSLPSSSLALVGIVEQNFSPVPEPATLAGLAIGGIALIRRRARGTKR